MVKLLPLHLKDDDLERVRRNHHEAIEEIQRAPGVGMTVLKGITLADGVATKVAHRLGRMPLWVGPSVPRGAVAAGYIVETERTDKFVTLTAASYGATITLDLAVA